MTAAGAAPSRSEPDRYFPCIDGLRAVAAVMVVAFHVAERAGLNRADTTSWVADYTSQLGRLGVAVFFTISGFLLYRPFAAAHLEGRPAPALGRYFRRRFLRIFPAYWLALLGFALLASPAVRDSITADLLLRISLLQGYSKDLALSGVSVAWTLTIELTFYLVVPLYAWLVRRLGQGLGRGQMLTAEWVGLGAFYCIGLLGRALLSDKVLPIGGLAAWTDLFAVGMLIAVVRANQKRGGGLPALFRYLGRFPTLAMAMALELVWVVALLDVPRGFQPKTLSIEYSRHFLYGFVGLLLLAPLVFGNQQRTPYRRVMRSFPLRWTGEVSYGLYLWHVLVLYLLTTDTPAAELSFWPMFAATLAITLVIASASWVLLERPIQHVQFRHLVPTGDPGPATSDRGAEPEPSAGEPTVIARPTDRSPPP